MLRFTKAVLAAALVATAVPAVTAPARADDVRVYSGTFDGLPYEAEVPPHWNGTLLLYSNVNFDGVLLASYPESEKWLVDHGYALAAASTTDIKTTINGQRAMLDWFDSHVGRPRQTISWGQSLGGISAVQLAEREPRRFAGVGVLCAPLGGLISAWNSFLDLNFVMKTLLAPDSDLQLVHITDWSANWTKAMDIINQASTTPQGRARLALANAVANIPGWFGALSPRPPTIDGQIDQLVRFNIATFGVTGGDLRQEFEQTAGGNASWNTGVDYDKLFAESSERTLAVEAYKAAGLSLEKDLRTLAKAPRVAADPQAVAYERQYGLPEGRTPWPVITLHTISDGMSTVQNERWYAAEVRRHGDPARLRQVFVGRGGHCTYTAAEEIVMLQNLLDRVRTGHWNATDPATLNAEAARFPHEYQKVSDWLTDAWGQTQPDFVPFHPGPLLRPVPESPNERR